MPWRGGVGLSDIGRPGVGCLWSVCQSRWAYRPVTTRRVPLPIRDAAMWSAIGSGTRAVWRAMNPVSAAVRRGGDECVHGAPGADGIIVAGREASRYMQDGRMPYVDTVSARLAGLPIEVFSLVDFSGDFA